MSKETVKAVEEEVKKDVVATQEEEKETAVGKAYEAPLGFDDDDDTDDVIIPRVKVIQTLSPERKEKEAEEGDIINSLTKERLNEKVFVPVFKFNNNINWRDRSDGGGILCIARDGKNGEASDGTHLICAACRKNEFDNSKQGREAIPVCTKYINFFGFFAGEKMPIILSFAKTNFKEGKKLYSLAKVSMQNMWNYGYTLTEKLMVKGGNEWYNIAAVPAGATNKEDRDFALEMFKTFRETIKTVAFDMDDQSVSADEAVSAPHLEKTEY
jgi:hypothetical protein